MKKIWLMLLMICSVCAFSACSDDDDDKKDDGNVEEVCPVKDVVVPNSIEAGEDVTISGEGFAEGAKLYLQKEGETDNIELENAIIRETKAIFTIPLSFPIGKYNIILKQNGEWKIGNIEILEAVRAPRMKGLAFTDDYGDTYTYDFKYNEKGQISAIIVTDVDWAPESPMNYKIEYNSDQITVSDFLEATYDLENGLIVNTAYDDNEGQGVQNFSWTYDEDNRYLTKGGYEEVNYNFVNDNLQSIGYGAIADFEGAQYKNRVNLIDPVICMYYFFTYEAFENKIVDLLPHWLGICGKSSTYLPVKILCLRDEELPIQYTMDDKYPQFIYEAKIAGSDYSFSLRFIYE